MKRIFVVVVLLAAVAFAAVAYAQVRARPGPARNPQAAQALPAQALVHENHLLVIRGGLINVYDLHNLPDVTLVRSVAIPASAEEASYMMQGGMGMMKGGKAAGGQSAGGSAKADGSKIYLSLGCHACHRIHGKGGTLGPDLSHIGKTQNAAWIKKKITDPKFDNKNSIMPAHELPAKQLDALANYLASLK
jgi:mono/diheme cytochrome c family protein